MPLTVKQQLFVAEYLKDLNATQAAIRAGYSEKTADVQMLARSPLSFFRSP
jgi:phage terminase small subunit